MERFIQLHLLTTYPASNLNRDDLGRPKTVMMGQTQRLRISSQSLKRAWRTSEYFSDALAGSVGIRTKELGKYIFRALMGGASLEEVLADYDATGERKTLAEKQAVAIARAIGGIFAKNKSEYKQGKKERNTKEFDEALETEQMAHLNPHEVSLVGELVEACRETGETPEKDALGLLRKEGNAVDVALFGRMLASNPEHNVEAAAQVAHAMTVHQAVVEDDFFTAVDDLNKEDSGAGHMGVAEFGAGVFYQYLCIDRQLLLQNLGNNKELCDKALAALVKAAFAVSPGGKQNSFASRAVASYCLAERGDVQPRTLAEAFLRPVTSTDGQDILLQAIQALEAKRDSFNRMMGEEPASCVCSHEQGTLKDICKFVAE